MALELKDLLRKLPQIQIKGDCEERTLPGKDGKTGFKIRTQAALLCVWDGDDELKARCKVDVPREAQPYLPGRYLIGGPTCLEIGDYESLSLNRRGIELIPIDDPANDSFSFGKTKS
jgi:hypothetical protein